VPRPTVLIVDDEVSYGEVIVEILRVAGADAVTLHDGQQVFHELERRRPSAMLLDVMMPGTDGLHLLQQIRSQPAWSDLPIVVASARALIDQRVEALDAGASAFLPKPFSAHELRATLRRFLPLAQTGVLSPA
jgi:two-component system phosphate regulon response regulator OmpR